MAGNTGTIRAFPKLFSDVPTRDLISGFVPHNPDIVLHRFLQIVLNLIGIFAVPSLKGRHRFRATRSILSLSIVPC